MTSSRFFWVFLLVSLSCLATTVYESSSSDVLVRKRRQSGLCPSRAARDSRGSDMSYLLMYSANDRRDVKISRPSELKKAGFSPELPTVIYMHAFTQSSNSDWLKNIRVKYNKILKDGKPSFNMIFFDWSAYSRQQYGRAASYVPYLGDRLSDFLAELAQTKYNISQVHLVSYSLSTHIAGQTGRQLQSKSGLKLGQITALDPTGVCFHEKSSAAERWSLKPSDAELVVAKHYDMGGLGARRSIGGVDVFVNSGKSQPSARSVRGGYSSHARAAAHESSVQVRRQCHEVAYACRSYSAFLAGECASCGDSNNKCYYMDTMDRHNYHENEINSSSHEAGTKMYLKTSGGPNFCLHHYQVQLKLRSNSTSSAKQQVKSSNVSFKIDSSLQVTPTHKISPTRYTSLLTSSSKSLGKTLTTKNSVKIKFNGNENLSDSIEQLEFNYMSHPLSEERIKRSAKFCPSEKSRELIRC